MTVFEEHSANQDICMDSLTTSVEGRLTKRVQHYGSLTQLIKFIKDIACIPLILKCIMMRDNLC